MIDTFGDASKATEAELLKLAGTRKPRSIFLGRYWNAEAREAGEEILYNGERHLLVFGPNGSGKGMRFLVPNLLRGIETQSTIVIDPKGEIAAMTAHHRRQIGHEVIILNPFNVLGLESAGFNPLSGLDPESPTFYDDAAAIGEALIKVGGKDPHWSESAQGLVVALIMWEKKRNGENANLENVRHMLTEAEDWVDEIDEDGSTHRRPVAGLRVTAAQMVVKGDYAIQSLAARFTKETQEIGSIQSAADTQTRWLLSKPVRDDLKKKNGIDFRQLKKKRTTVYVILPAERLRTHSVWLRLVIVSALRSLYRPGGLRTVMLIDEMAALGHLAPLEDAFGLVRGYRVQVAAFFQDLSQLKALYKERWETFIANAGVVFAFAPNDLTTAEWMSKRSGQATARAKGTSESTPASAGGHASSSLSEQQVGRPLFFPHELIGLEEGMGLLWLAGLGKSTRFYAPFFRRIKECRERAMDNPFYQPDDDD